ncbi:MAG: DsbE family thiol:disulfide interchange protein [Steroidobacteraceae bacterium]
MNRFLLPLGAFALLALVLAVGLKNAPEKGVIVSPLVGKQGPAYDMPDLHDVARRVTSNDYKGSWHLINVWGSWCEACRVEHPVLLAIQGEARLPIVGIDWRDEEADGLAWLQQRGNPYTRVGVDKESRVAIDYGVTGAPETFLVNPDGVIAYKHVGPVTPQIWREQILARLPASTQ